MKVTKEMIGAAHDICLKKGDFVLSADLLERVYLAMDALANHSETSGSLKEQLAAVKSENEKLREDAERVLNSARAFLNCDELRSCVKLRATSEYVDLFNSVNNSTIDAVKEGK